MRHINWTKLNLRRSKSSNTGCATTERARYILAFQLKCRASKKHEYIIWHKNAGRCGAVALSFLDMQQPPEISNSLLRSGADREFHRRSENTEHVPYQRNFALKRKI